MEAGTIASVGGSADGTDALVEVACLSIKVSTAEHIGEQALATYVGGGRTDARALAARIQRHADAARSALRGVSTALTATEPYRPPTVMAFDEFSARVAKASVRWRLPIAAAAIVTAMVLLPGWLDRSDAGEPAREGTLAGNESSGDSVGSPPPTSSPEGVAADQQVVTFSFDQERIDLGIGTEWRQSSGAADAVALAGFPTAVDRSARLENVDGAGAETCRASSVPSARLTRLVADVFVAGEPATATLIVRRATGPDLRVNLGTSESSVVIGGDTPIAHERALQIGQWYQVAIAVDDDRTLWRVGRLDIAWTSYLAGIIDIGALEGVDEVCLAISEDSAGHIHFDNVTIETTAEG